MQVRKFLGILALATVILATLFGKTVLCADGDPPEAIGSVSIDLATPRQGSLPYGIERLVVGGAEPYYATHLLWLNEDGVEPATLDSNGRFEAETVYSVQIELTAKGEYCFDTNTAVNVTFGELENYDYLLSAPSVDAEGNTLTFSVTFEGTESLTYWYIVYFCDDQTEGLPPVDPNSYELGTGLGKGAEILGSGTLKRTGYTFSGWKDTLTLTSFNPGDTLTNDEGDVTLYEIYLVAKWDPVISELELAGLRAPEAGELPMAFEELPETETEFYSVTSMLWKNADGTSEAELTLDGRFKAGTVYTAEFRLKAKPGFRFSTDCAVHLAVEGMADLAPVPVVTGDEDENEMTFLVTFETAELAVTEIQVTRQPDKMGYIEVTDNVLSLAGMEVTETYNNGSTAIVQFADGTSPGYTSDPVHGALLTHDMHDNKAVTIRHLASGLTAQTGIIAVTAAPIQDDPEEVENHYPTGAPYISGTFLEGQSLTAFTDSISDRDGIGAFSYVWQVSDDGIARWQSIAGASGATFVISRRDTGKYLRVRVSYTDGAGTRETLVSTPTGLILALGPVLTADTSDNDVDHEIVITFAPDPVFENAITRISYSGNTLVPAQYAVESGTIRLLPAVGVNSYLRVSGTADLVIAAKGFAETAVSQTINAGAAKVMAITRDVMAPSSHGAEFAGQPEITLRDAYGNICVNDSSTVVFAYKKDAGQWTLEGPTTAVAESGVVSFRGLRAANDSEILDARLAFSSGDLAEVVSAAVTLPPAPPPPPPEPEPPPEPAQPSEPAQPPEPPNEPEGSPVEPDDPETAGEHTPEEGRLTSPSRLLRGLFGTGKVPGAPVIDMRLDVSLGSATADVTAEVQAQGLKPFTEVTFVVYCASLSEPVVSSGVSTDSSGTAGMNTVFPVALGSGAQTVIARGTGPNDEPVQSVSAFDLDGNGVVTAYAPPSQVLDPIQPGSERLVRAMLANKPLYDARLHPGTVSAVAIVIGGLGGIAAIGGVTKPKSRTRKRTKVDDLELPIELVDLIDTEIQDSSLDLGNDNARWGDLIWIRKIPGTPITDQWSPKVFAPLSRVSSFLYRTAFDGSWARAVFGSAGFILWVAGAILGAYSAFQVGFAALPPPFPVVLVIFVLGIMDGGAGLISWLIIALAALVTGHVRTLDEVRTLAGMLTLFSSMLCLVGLRPIIRGLGGRKKYLFDRIVDYLMPGAIIAVASAIVLESINGLSGLELFAEANCRTIQIVAIAAYWIRLAAEDIVTWGFPARGRIVRPVASQEQLMVFQWGALLAYLAMSVLVSEPFYGLSTPLFVIMGLTTVPWVLSFVEERFPNSQLIYKWYTDLPFIFRLTLLTLVNILLSALLIGDSSDYRQICSAYVVMTIPYTLADMVDLFGREGEGLPDSWPRRIAETCAWVLFSLITLEILRFG